jgi:iron complex transport system permease protein
VKTRIFAIVAGCLLVLSAAAWIGPALDGPRGAFIFWQLRVPRVLVGGLVGATLALAGAVFQALFNNPLATPSTVGTTAGATLGALAALSFDVSPDLEGLPIVTAFAFAGALATSFLVAGVARAGRAHMSDVLLAGIAVTLAASALATGIQYVSDARALFSAVQWSLGQLPQVGYHGVFLLAPFAALSSIALLALTRALQSGPIAFVGLIVPHLVRLVVGPSLRVLLPLSLLGGAGFLVLCDTASRLLIPGRELPVGVITAALGAPALVVLIARARQAG